jgi:beta-lactamase superfamily II metal-dependent hydrolase
MFEVDILRAGEEKDADAICMRFTRPDTDRLAHVVVDAGWQDDGDALVDFVQTRYKVGHVDLAIVTHPDRDHIGGMRRVVGRLDVGTLLVHRLDERGGASLDGSGAVSDLVAVAAENGTAVAEPFQGRQYFGDALTILGPSEPYYTELVEQQKVELSKKAAPLLGSLRESGRRFADRVLEIMPIEEVPFGDGPGTGPCNNSSTVILLTFHGYRALLTADAGVPAIGAALDFAEAVGLDGCRPDLVQIPHHGSRRNASSELLDRVLGPIGSESLGRAIVSVCSKDDPKHPSGRVVNAYRRRGYRWNWTAGDAICWHSLDAGGRPDYGPLPDMPAMTELPDED